MLAIWVSLNYNLYKKNCEISYFKINADEYSLCVGYVGGNVVSYVSSVSTFLQFTLVPAWGNWLHRYILKFGYTGRKLIILILKHLSSHSWFVEKLLVFI